MSWLAWRTGGLEAPIALHAANNMVSLAFTAATGSLEESLTASTLAWSYALLDVAMMLAFAVVVHLLADRWGVACARRSPRGVPALCPVRARSAILVRARQPRRQRGATTHGVWGNWQPD